MKINQLINKQKISNGTRMTRITKIYTDNKSALICSFRVISVLFLFICFFYTAHAQNRATISGTVTDSTGKALDGASISVFGMPVATVTNTDGNYSLSIPAQAIKIVFSYAGLKADTLSLQLQP